MAQTVLVVDDERDIVELIRYNLTQAGFRIVSATDGQQAIDQTKRERPDLIVLDLMRPVIPGNEVARLLRQDEKTRAIPILMLTARRSETDRIVGFELGADDYVVKPFSPRELAPGAGDPAPRGRGQAGRAHHLRAARDRHRGAHGAGARQV